MLEPKKDLFENIQEEPLEHYTLQVDPQKVAPVEKAQLASYKRRMLTVIALFAIACVFGIQSHAQVVTGLALGSLFCIVVAYFKSLSTYKKAFAKSALRFSETVYDYSLYHDYLIVWISSEQSIKQMKYQLSDIKKAQIIADFVVLEIDGRLFLLNKDELTPNSYFISRCYQGK